MRSLLFHNEDMETSELIQRVKENDPEACKEMFEGFHRMIHSIINDYQLEYGDFLISREDLYQEALIGIYEACFAYQLGSNAKFSTFVYIVIKRRINRFYKNHLRRYINESYSLDNMDFLDHREEFKASSVSEDPIAYHKQEELKESLNRLSDLDREILQLRMKNYSYAQIAHKLDISSKKVDNRLYKLKKRFLRNHKT